MFNEKGYEETTIDEIIAGSNTSKGSFYHYFNSKDELLSSLSELFDVKYEEEMANLDPEMNSYDKLLYLCYCVHDMIQDEVPVGLLASLYASQVVTKGSKHLLDQNRYYYRMINILVEEGQRRGQIRNDMTYLPLKINSASVIPVIFASAIMTAPLTIMSFFEANSFTTTLNNILSLQKPLGLCIYAVLIVLFTFFYTNLQVDPEKIAENLGKSGTYIPGIRPGTETKEYLSKVLNRITVLGAIFLVFIALLPYVLPMVTSLPSSVSMGGTGIIIVVGVALDTVKQLEAQMLMRHHKGFLE